MTVELVVPAVGESITEVQIGEWMKSPGDYVDTDEVVVEIETDKASMELPAPTAGVIEQVMKQTGESANVGDVVATIDDTAARPAADEATAPEPGGEATETTGISGPTIMPAAQRLLAENALPAESVTATGPGGRMLKEDVQRHLEQTGPLPEPAPPTGEAGIQGDAGRREEAVPMSLIRRRIAERLVEAQQTAALLTTFNECDMSEVMALRTDHRERFQEKYGIKLGFMSFFVKAAVDALKAVPEVNAQIRDRHIIYHDYCDIGVAIGGGKGLVVPVLRNAERMSFAAIEQAIADFAARASKGRLSPEELQGGTFTISNGGVYGSLLSTPIVNPPQSAILGMHAIQERAVVVHGEIVARPMMYLALTYDHRIVDGREAVTFLRRIKDCIEDPARMLLEV